MSTYGCYQWFFEKRIYLSRPVMSQRDLVMPARDPTITSSVLGNRTNTDFTCFICFYLAYCKYCRLTVSMLYLIVLYLIIV